MNERKQVEKRAKIGVVKRDAIMNKSNNKCCHCGKLISFDKKEGYEQATVEHFIPISKSGTNSIINLVALCPECNREKDDYILYPTEYLDYLQDKYIKELEDYFEEWADSYNYLCENNLFACDVYKVGLSLFDQSQLKGFTYAQQRSFAKWVWLKRALPKDIAKLANALQKAQIRTLKNRANLQVNNEAKQMILDVCKANLNSFFEIGSVYYTEKSDGIKSIHIAFADREDDDLQYDNFIVVKSIALYNKRDSLLDSHQISKSIPNLLLRENDIDNIPIYFEYMDCVFEHIFEPEFQVYCSDWEKYNYILENKIELNLKEDEKLIKFFSNFDIENNIAVQQRWVEESRMAWDKIDANR